MEPTVSVYPVGKGPNGAPPQSTDSVDLSESEVDALRAADYTVAIVFHYLGTSYVRLQRAGLTDRFEELGIDVEGVYDSKFDASEQVDILNRLAETDVDAVVSIPVDQVATADAYRTLADSGTDLVFIDNVPEGFEHPDDYAGAVSSDNRGLGIFAGRFLRDQVGEGTVGFISFDAPYYVTSARESGARDTLADATDVDIVAERGFTDTDAVEDITREVLTENPDIDGLFVSWSDPPGIQAAEAALDLDRSDLVITTTGLSSRSAEVIARDGPIKATSGQFPYTQGVTEANMVGHSLLANTTPQFIASGVLPIHRGNLLEQYPTYYQESPPDEITRHYD